MHFVSVTKTNSSVLCGLTVTVSARNDAEYINTRCGQNCNFLVLKEVVFKVTTLF
jgi:hypothetical protein